MNNHVEKTKQGVVWSFINNGGIQIFRLITTFLLVRLISPKEFGQIGMITIFSEFAAIFISFGFSNALIQKKDISQQDINTTFVFNCTLGFILCLLFFLCAPYIAIFYDEPVLESLTKSISVIFLLTSVSGVNNAIAIKNLNFKTIAIINLLSVIISSILAIVLAYLKYGVWALIIQLICFETLKTLLYLKLLPVSQKFSFSKKSFGSMLHFGANVAGDSIINYWSRNADNLLIAKMLGESALGLYTKAYGIMLLPLTNISRVIGQVMFPSFSLIQDNKQEIKRIYLKATNLISFVTFPMMAGLAVLANEFTLSFFGNEWAEIIPLIRVLSVVGAIQSILTLNGTIYNSLSRPDIAFKITIVYSIIFIVGFFYGIRWNGLNGLAIIYSILVVVGAIPNFYFAGRLINVSLIEMAKNLFPSFLTSMIMALFVHYSIEFIIKNFHIENQIILLFIGIAIGILIFFLLSMLFMKNNIKELLKIIKK